ncbi:hypothetical protein LJC74_04645 [Eubacteriales bacterium OttesenSCG-928-A19]|nr:hypothetical protein [Eubacteriales bacterium OttesenSCG-928-A19]
MKIVKKMGRPTDDPKRNNTRVRMSDAEQKKLDYSASILGLSKAEIIRQGIDHMYEKAMKKALDK